MKTCHQCGKPFPELPGKGQYRKIYCGPDCYRAAAALRQKASRGVVFPITVQCGECGKPFDAYSTTARYCGAACSEYRRQHGTGPDSSRSCIVCGASIPRRSKLRRFCGRACELAEESRLKRVRSGEDFGTQALILGSLVEKTDDE